MHQPEGGPPSSSTPAENPSRIQCECADRILSFQVCQTLRQIGSKQSFMGTSEKASESSALFQFRVRPRDGASHRGTARLRSRAELR